jgi:hypothetical protein
VGTFPRAWAGAVMTGMTQSERKSLTTLVNRWEKVAKSAVKERSAELLADFEEEVARTFKIGEDDVWEQAADEMREAINEANAKVRERCEELGIRKEFAPQLGAQPFWLERGENAANQRRAELRKVATRRVEVMEKAASADIERRSVELQTRLVAGGLESPDAVKFITDMQDQIKLTMPPVTLAQLEEGKS